MIEARSDPTRWWNGLRFRLVFMMSLALLPIGLIAVMQTRAVSEKVRRNTELALLAEIEQVAYRERLNIQRAFGVADSVAALVGTFQEDPETCSARLMSIMEQSDRFSFLGIIPSSGVMTCSTAGATEQLTSRPRFQQLVGSKERLVRVVPDAPISGGPVINVSIPLFDADKVVGRVSVSIPHSPPVPMSDRSKNDAFKSNALVEVLTFNDTGEILSSLGERDQLTALLPQGLTPANLTEHRARAFSTLDRKGNDRIYTVVPVEADQLYILGIWDAQTGVEEQSGDRLPPILFPALMWLTSLAVVLFAIHRLVSRHVRSLRRQMVRFARDRKVSEKASGSRDMPAELHEIQTSFNNMAYSIIRDEATLEDAVHEKNVLIREIHHRVKNNLQLISSILNMQIRDAQSDETRSVLRRVQDRVLSLATIHRDLYQANSAGRVNVGNLLKEIVQKSVEIGAETATAVRVETDIDDVHLYPDQAVPMSLLAAEAATNAMKYVDAREGTDPWIRVTFKACEDKTCVFRFENSARVNDTAGSTGMGARLINAFAIQLGATIEVESSDEAYTLTVTFTAADFSDEG